MPLQFNPDKCTRKTRCCATGEAYDPADPCSGSSEIFNPATCECETSNPSTICAQGTRAFYGFGEREYSFDLDANYVGETGVIEFRYTVGVAQDNGQVLPSDDPITFTLSGAVETTFTEGCFGCSNTIFFPKEADDDVFNVNVITQQDTGQPRNAWRFEFFYYCTPSSE